MTGCGLIVTLVRVAAMLLWMFYAVQSAPWPVSLFVVYALGRFEIEDMVKRERRAVHAEFRAALERIARRADEK